MSFETSDGERSRPDTRAPPFVLMRFTGAGIEYANPPDDTYFTAMKSFFPRTGSELARSAYASGGLCLRRRKGLADFP